jgi:predicted alpha/beta-hydrolase family hydrolase
LELGDPTGYKAAIDLLGSWKHWENAEIVASLNATGLETMVKAAARGDLKAAEFLMNYSVEGPPAKHKRGRPSKGEIKKAAREIASLTSELDEDAARILGRN